jgi:hypothetical protein
MDFVRLYAGDLEIFGLQIASHKSLPDSARYFPDISSKAAIIGSAKYVFFMSPGQFRCEQS